MMKMMKVKRRHATCATFGLERDPNIPDQQSVLPDDRWLDPNRPASSLH